ncbi:MAG: phosphoserine phosphatase SerB [Alphaproteobacteria bacterium]|nr:phosphoserine phosphatase SerB [Alphaproteobacteria bacterium]
MKYVITLIGNPKSKPVDMVVVDTAVTALARANAKLDKPDWLAKKRAVDIRFDRLQPLKALQLARAAIGDLPYDSYAQPIEGRRKKLLVADMDSTILVGETIDELAAEVGKKAEIARITALAMDGKLKYAESLKQRVNALAGLWVDKLDATYARLAVSAGAATLVATMEKHGALTVLVTGGFTYFTDRVAAALGFDRVHANELEIVGGKLTGVVKEPILDGNAKRTVLEQTARELKIELREAVAVGDGANDRGMIEGAGLGVAYRAKPALADYADARLDHADLTGLLYLQGYREDELVVRPDTLTPPA